MGKPITDEQWDALLAAFREEPGNFEHARKTAHCQWRTAREAWEHGCSKRRPISAILDDEAKMRRAVVAQGAEELEAAGASERLKMAEQMAAMRAEMDDLRRMAGQFVDGAKRARNELLEAGGLDAAKDYEREGQMVRALQAFTLNSLGLVTALQDVEAYENLADTILRDAKRKDLTTAEAAKLIRLISGAPKAIAEVVEIAQNATRKYLGAPTSIVQRDVRVSMTSTPEELRAIDERTAGRLAALRRYGHVPEDDGELDGGPALAELPAPATTPEPLPGDEKTAV